MKMMSGLFSYECTWPAGERASGPRRARHSGLRRARRLRLSQQRRHRGVGGGDGGRIWRRAGAGIAACASLVAPPAAYRLSSSQRQRAGRWRIHDAVRREVWHTMPLHFCEALDPEKHRERRIKSTHAAPHRVSPLHTTGVAGGDADSIHEARLQPRCRVDVVSLRSLHKAAWRAPLSGDLQVNGAQGTHLRVWRHLPRGAHVRRRLAEDGLFLRSEDLIGGLAVGHKRGYERPVEATSEELFHRDGAGGAGHRARRAIAAARSVE